ncbi:MAG: F0F1 ATP synthase subunit B [Gammaproteobacteria bacterium]|nr:F0F1 ATP synthase subunit B [Gammaproteobacteria bacterium]MDE0301992.1 F0F1 ATP synthase subunit B [Gammaproteobacteria bacterium]
MNINLTLIGQAISFTIFVWFCMRFIWPPVINALEARKKRIADGLADADAAKTERERAEQEAQQTTGQAREEASRILAQAERRAGEIVAEARATAKTEGERILTQAQEEIDKNTQQVREQLRGEVAALAVAGAEAVLRREVDAKTHAEALDQLAERL